MRSFVTSLTLIATFFLSLYLFTPTQETQNSPGTPVVNSMQSQRQAEAVQKTQVLAERKNSIPVQDSFSQFVSNAFQQLPSENDARISGQNNPHDTPEAVMKAGALIGYVADQMKKDPKNVETGLKFYKACAQSENVVSTLRAVCLRNLVDFSSRYRNNIRVSFADYPENIQRIARHIPRLR